MGKILADNRPTDYIYALMSEEVYKDSNLELDSTLPGFEDWEVVHTKTGSNGFFGAFYRNRSTNQLVVAFKGTDSFGALVEDLKGVYFNGLSPQKEAAFELTREAIQIARRENLQLSFTGHSLGAYLAELSILYCYVTFRPQPKDKRDIRDDVCAVTFESPGSREVMEVLQSQLKDHEIDIDSLDITNYLSYPNLVNTCNHHVGSVYALTTTISSWSNLPLVHLKQVHTMSGIVALFAQAPQHQPSREKVVDWPLGKQRHTFFEYVKLEEERYQWVQPVTTLIDQFDITFQGHYRLNTIGGDWQKLPLRHCTRPLQIWLKTFYAAFEQWKKQEGLVEQLKAAWDEAGIPDIIIGYLMSAMLAKDEALQYKTPLVWLDVNSEDKKQTAIWLRQELSEWLKKNEEKAKALIEIVTRLPKEATDADIAAVILDTGSRIAKGGVVENASAQALSVYLPPQTDEAMTKHFQTVSERFFDSIKKAGIKIKAVAVAKGAIVEGTLKNINVSAVQMTVGSYPQFFTQPNANASASSSISEVTRQPKKP